MKTHEHDQITPESLNIPTPEELKGLKPKAGAEFADHFAALLRGARKIRIQFQEDSYERMQPIAAACLDRNWSVVLKATILEVSIKRGQ